MNPNRTVVVLSGGMDSVCYASILSLESKLYAISFSYGQRAQREIVTAKYFARLLGAKDHRIVDIEFMKSLYGSSNALTDSRQSLTANFSNRLVVPLRNALFLTIASAWAMSIGARLVAYGAHTGDLTHYPDCRPEFTSALTNALNLGEFGPSKRATKHLLTIMSPALSEINKPSLAKSGYKILGENIFKTWSCYSNGVKSERGWLQCGNCESCISRKRAFRLARIEDHTRYVPRGNRRHAG